MQDGIAPDEIEGCVGERQASAASAWTHSILDAVAVRPIASLGEIAAGKFEPRDDCAASRQDDGCHAVAAAQIENAAAADVAEPGHRRADPAFVIEIGVVVDEESFGGQIGTASCRLGVVILALHCQPRHRVPFA